MKNLNITLAIALLLTLGGSGSHGFSTGGRTGNGIVKDKIHTSYSGNGAGNGLVLGGRVGNGFYYRDKVGNGLTSNFEKEF